MWSGSRATEVAGVGVSTVKVWAVFWSQVSAGTLMSVWVPLARVTRRAAGRTSWPWLVTVTARPFVGAVLSAGSVVIDMACCQLLKYQPRQK